MGLWHEERRKTFVQTTDNIPQNRKTPPADLARMIICSLIMVPITISIFYFCESSSSIGWYGFGGMCANGLFFWLPLIHWWVKFPFGNHYDPDIPAKRIYPDGRTEKYIHKGKKTGVVSGFFQGLGFFIAMRLIFELIKHLLFS